MGTQHSGLRDDNSKINSLSKYLLSHAPTAGRAIVRYRVWGRSHGSAASNDRARLTEEGVTAHKQWNGEALLTRLCGIALREAPDCRRCIRKRTCDGLYYNETEGIEWYVVRQWSSESL